MHQPVQGEILGGITKVFLPYWHVTDSADTSMLDSSNNCVTFYRSLEKENVRTITEKHEVYVT